MTASLYREMRKAQEGYQFREYRCTGTRCYFETYGPEGIQYECNTVGCRGQVTPRHRISHKNYAYRQMQRLMYVKGVYKPRFDPRKYHVSPTQRRETERRGSSGSPYNTYPQTTQKSVETTNR